MLAAVIAGIAGSPLLKRILKPLSDVVQQAEAIGERRFINIDEPKTLEFRKVSTAMNAMSARVKQMLNQEASRIEKWQREAQVDNVTGLKSREAFLQTIETTLISDDANAAGSVALVRLGKLAQLNELYGRQSVDNLLHDIGKSLDTLAFKNSRWIAGRFSGSDLGILSPRATDALAVGREMQSAIYEVLVNYGMQSEIDLPGACTLYQFGDKKSALLTRLDGALIASEGEGSEQVIEAFSSDIPAKPMKQQLEDWQIILESGLNNHAFSLAKIPVVDR